MKMSRALSSRARCSRVGRQGAPSFSFAQGRPQKGKQQTQPEAEHFVKEAARSAALAPREPRPPQLPLQEQQEPPLLPPRCWPRESLSLQLQVQQERRWPPPLWVWWMPVLRCRRLDPR